MVQDVVEGRYIGGLNMLANDRVLGGLKEEEVPKDLNIRIQLIDDF